MVERGELGRSEPPLRHRQGIKGQQGIGTLLGAPSFASSSEGWGATTLPLKMSVIAQECRRNLCVHLLCSRYRDFLPSLSRSSPRPNPAVFRSRNMGIL